MAKLNVGVVGAGYFGKFHAEKYSRLPQVNLVGIVDTNPERALDVAAKNNTQPFSAPNDLYDRVEAVSIAVPTPQHYSVACEFLKRKIHVLLEKPITSTVPEAKKLIELAQAKNLILQIGHLERFNPALTALHHTLTNPRFIESHRLQSFIERAVDVDVTMDLMIHDIDVEKISPDRMNGLILRRQRLEGLFVQMKTMTIDERIKLPGLDRGRADVILAGCMVVIRILHFFKSLQLVVSLSDLLEGIVIAYLKGEEDG